MEVDPTKEVGPTTPVAVTSTTTRKQRRKKQRAVNGKPNSNRSAVKLTQIVVTPSRRNDRKNSVAAVERLRRPCSRRLRNRALQTKNDKSSKNSSLSPKSRWIVLLALLALLLRVRTSLQKKPPMLKFSALLLSLKNSDSNAYSVLLVLLVALVVLVLNDRLCSAVWTQDNLLKSDSKSSRLNRSNRLLRLVQMVDRCPRDRLNSSLKQNRQRFLSRMKSKGLPFPCRPKHKLRLFRCLPPRRQNKFQRRPKEYLKTETP